MSLISTVFIPNENLARLKKMFLELDTSNDGFLSKEEFQKGLADGCGDLMID